jgi:hypothetical protein
MALRSFKISIPLTSLQPNKYFKDDLINYSQNMVSEFGRYFRAAAIGTNVPVQFLYAVAMVEMTGTHYNPNGSVNVSGSERSVGLMQISPAAFYEALKKELPKSRLSPQSIAIIQKYLPSLGLQNGMTLQGTPSAAILNTIFLALKKPEFNIWASAIDLRLFLESTANSDGTMRPDKAIIKYNIGDYSKPTKLDVFLHGDTTSLIKAVNSITSNYIVKVAGSNGAMDYFIKNKIA